jgi:hypothetical protein
MNYLEWNNAIIKHFFNPENEEKEVMLYFSEAIIEEIGINNFLKPDIGYVEDFYLALRQGVNGISNDNYIQRILILEQKYLDDTFEIDHIPIEYPPYFIYFLAFILPFTSGNSIEDYNMNNFHDYVKQFFEIKQLTNNYNGTIRNHLNDIDFLWKKINNWLIEQNNFSLGYLEEIDLPGNRSYVGKFEYHILFRKEQEERLSMVFDNNEILPDEAINEQLIRKILVNNHRYLRLSTSTRNKIADPNDYIGNKILKRALTFYNNWDGTNYTVEGSRGFSRNRLVLCLDFNLITSKIIFKYLRIFSKHGIPENINLKSKNGISLENIYQVNQYYSNPINDCFKNIDTEVQLVDNAARGKYTWKNRAFHIFKKMSNFDWVEVPKIEFNAGKTLIICKRAFYENELKEWFDNINFNKKLYDNNERTQIPADWLALIVESITNYPHPTIQELIPDREQKAKINFDKSFYFDGTLFKDRLPTVWLENTETNGDVTAKYEDGSELMLFHTTNDEDGIITYINQYSFTEEHIKYSKLNLEFKLVCNNISYHRFLRITDFIKRTNIEIENLLPRRDAIGQLTLMDKNYFKGIEHYFSESKIVEIIPFQNQLNNIFINNKNNEKYRQNSEYNSTQLGNILIHYISTKGAVNKREFNDLVFSLLKSRKGIQENIKIIAIRLSYLLQELGFIDYDSVKSMFYINKPHLVIIPTQLGVKFNLIGSRDASMINAIINYCRKNTSITIEVVTLEDNELLPQTINFYLRKSDHNLILNLVRTFGFIFKKGNLFTQFALTACFPDISNWSEYIRETPGYEIVDIEGGYLFDIETLKFINKTTDFKKDLSFIKYTNINGYRTIYRLWFNNICFNIPDQQLGVYLYLFLHNKLSEENYYKCVAERGSVNCLDEKIGFENAQLKTNIIVYDKDRKLLAVPLNCRLPRYFSISYQLMSGYLPIIKKLRFEGVRYDGVYCIYQNIPKLFYENNLNFKLLKRNVQHPIFNRPIHL